MLNPIAAPLAVTRSSLIGTLVAALRRNLAQRIDRVRVFEIGRVYRLTRSVAAANDAVAGVAQPVRVGALAYGDAAVTQWGSASRRVDFYDIKGDLEALLAPFDLRCTPAQHPALHPGRSADLWLGDHRIGVVGELHPRWRQAYELPHAPVLFELDASALQQRELPSFAPIGRFQAVQRDQAFVVSERVSHDQLLSALLDDPTGWCAAPRCSTSTGPLPQPMWRPVNTVWPCAWN